MTNESCSDGHIVIAGDSESGFSAIEHVLDALGLPCASGTFEELVAYPEIAPPRLIVLDSDKDRDERCRQQDRLRRVVGVAGAPLIVLGSDSSSASLSLAISHGASAYLAKPVNDVELLAVAGKLLIFEAEARHDERRRDPRRPVFLPVELERAQGRRRNKAWVVDASRHGCRIETNGSVGAGEMVRVWLPSTEATAHLPLIGETCWAEEVSGGRRRAGIQFTASAALVAVLALGLDGGDVGEA